VIKTAASARPAPSPQVKAENLKELESHVRDSVVHLEMKGLSAEESFLIATHRVGSPGRLEPEFAKVNHRPLNLFIHGLIWLFLSLGCWFLWVILHFPQMMTSRSGLTLPAFTRFVVGLESYLVLPPLLAAVYCGWIWVRRSSGSHSWVGFFASTIAVLLLLALPTLIAVFLPVIAFINQSVPK
jgi:hypothetical protein